MSAQRNFNCCILGPSGNLTFQSPYAGFFWHFIFNHVEILEGYKAVTVASEEDKKSQRSLYAQLEAVADMKFTYVATCQNYGNQKRSGDRHGTDILNLMVKYVSLQFSGTFLQIYFF